MKRPEHLPDFADPPLDEVVISVQFAPVPGYNSVHSEKVWELFRPEFPRIAEQPMIETQFETFGGSNIDAGPRIHVGAPLIGSRLWFISDDDNHLLQFQSDRLISNWRRHPNPQPYPRFEGLSGAFENNLQKLASHFSKQFGYVIDVNQAEVTYINIIPVDDFADIGNWLSLWNDLKLNLEGLILSFSEVINDKENRPFARLKHDIQSVFAVDGKKKAIRLTLTYKGKPRGNDIASAMRFLAGGREAIVTRFGEITTENAHEEWGVVR
ncbi:TIGR04255 family protein [Roseibium sp.]|uniref:TIGR04255 family protein n=1 Tax=Roseibium sp. TaxID=1936156 RepID=UPI003B5249E8